MKDKKYRVRENFREFQKQLPELIEKHEGKYVVFHDCKLCEIFEHELDAVWYARNNFEIGQYIVQEIHNREPQPESISLLV